MRKSLMLGAVGVMVLTLAGPALAAQRQLAVDTRRVDFGRVEAPDVVYSDAIRITNLSDETLQLTFAVTLQKPRDWSEAWSPFIVEDAGTEGDWESCAELAPGQTCVVYLAFQTDRAGMFLGTFWINEEYRVRLRARAT